MGLRKEGGSEARSSAGATMVAGPTGRETCGTGAGAIARIVSAFTDCFAAVLSHD